ncbi:MAG: PD40 domain-containing protein [Anaerolinea sp.]|nr:PD40 domain-containing protein [Anaerolinea sp.]
MKLRSGLITVCLIAGLVVGCSSNADTSTPTSVVMSTQTSEPTREPNSADPTAETLATPTIAPATDMPATDTPATNDDSTVTLVAKNLTLSTPPVWSPDGKTLALTTSSYRYSEGETEKYPTLHFFTSDGKPITEVKLEYGHQMSDLVWSPDSRYLLGVLRHGLILVFSAEGKQVGDVTPPKVQNALIRFPAWLPDSSGFLLDVANDTLGVIAPDGKTLRQLGPFKDKLQVMTYSVPTLGQQLLFPARDKTALYAVDMVTGDATDLLKDQTFEGFDKAKQAGRMVVSSDHTWSVITLAKPEFKGYVIGFLDADGKLGQVVDEPGTISDTIPAPKGNTLAVIVQRKTNRDLDTLKLFDSMGNALGETPIFSSVAWLPDGSGLLGANDKGRLTVFGLDAKPKFVYEAWRLQSDLFGLKLPTFAFSPDGQLLALIDRPTVKRGSDDGSVQAETTVHIVDSQGQLVRSIVGNNEPPARWSPDSKWIVLSVVKQGIQMIRLN